MAEAVSPSSPRIIARNLAVATVTILLVFLVAFVDDASGTELRIYPLYFVPVTLASWWLPRAYSLITVGVCGVSWELTNHFGGVGYTEFWVWPANTAMQVTSFMIVGLLVSALRQRIQIETDLARTDPLTGLLNLRAFRIRLAEELVRARRYQRPLTIVYLDLDNFKKANDTYGHATGDRILRGVASAMVNALRSSDAVARLGGDEFALLMIEVAPADAELLLQRLQERLRLHLAETQPGLGVGVSVGAACFVKLPETDEALIARADALMYRAKNAGKNQIIFECIRHEISEPVVAAPGPMSLSS